jgi:hypothetical protein
MRVKKIVASTVLAVAASGAAILVTAAPAAATLPSVSVPGMSRDQLQRYCAERGGFFYPGYPEYDCYLPNGSIIICRQGENCRIILIRPRPTPRPRRLTSGPHPRNPHGPVARGPGTGGGLHIRGVACVQDDHVLGPVQRLSLPGGGALRVRQSRTAKLCLGGCPCSGRTV